MLVRVEFRLLEARLRISGYSVLVIEVPSVGRQNLCSWVVMGFKPDVLSCDLWMCMIFLG